MHGRIDDDEYHGGKQTRDGGRGKRLLSMVIRDHVAEKVTCEQRPLWGPDSAGQELGYMCGGYTPCGNSYNVASVGNNPSENRAWRNVGRGLPTHHKSQALTESDLQKAAPGPTLK